MSFELETLRQRISELEAKNAELEGEKTKIEQEFRNRIEELETRNAELLKQLMEGNTKRDIENAELKSKVGEVESRLMIMEQGSLTVNGQPQNDKEAEVLPEVTISDVDLSNTIIDQLNSTETKSSE